MTESLEMYPAVKLAVAHLRGILDSGNVPDGRLPSIREFASAAGVSPVTMRKAVRILRDEGSLRVVRGGYITPAGAHATPSGTREAGTLKWQRAYTRIKQDINEGVYGAATDLPSSSELQYRYGVTWQTITKAPKKLVAEHMVSPLRRGFRVLSPPVRDHSAKIVLIGGPDTFGELFVTPRTEEFLRALERVCHTHGIQFERFVYCEKEGIPVYRDIHNRTRKNLDRCGSVLGFIIWPELIPKLMWLVKQLRTYGRPITILDEYGDVSLPAVNPRVDRIEIISVANSTRPGRDVGNYLLRQGHRKVAFIAPFHRNRWSANRYRGLVEAFEGAGYNDAVTCHADTQYINFWDMCRNNPIPDPSFDKFDSQLHHLCDSYLKKDTGISAQFARDVDRVRWLLVNLHQVDMERKFVGTILKKALEVRGATAWVGENDTGVIFALDFLEERGIKAPDTISLIGFDDSMEAFNRGLTSYNFNIQGIVNRMLSFILSPGRRGARPSLTPVEVAGMVIHRRTTIQKPAGKKMSGQ